MKILYVQHDSGLSGSTISLSNLLKSIDRKQFTPHVGLYTDGPAKELLTSLGIPVTIIKGRRFGTAPGPNWQELDYYLNWLALLPNKAWKIFLQREKPDIIHINDKACLQVGITAKNMGIPIIWHLRSSYYPSSSKLQAHVSCYLIRKIASHFIAISEDEVDGFEDLPNLSIINNSLDFSEVKIATEKRQQIRDELGLSADEIGIATLTSTISEVRGTWDFIRSAALVRRHLPERKLKFFIVAKIPTRPDNASNSDKHTHPLTRVEELIKEFDLTDCLTLTGYRNDPLAVMAAMDVVVVCNRHGVMGRMPFEAMSVGTPVVATKGHSGRSSILINGETGLLALPADPVSISDNIIRIIEDTKLAMNLRQKGITYAQEHFDPSQNARKIEKIYSGLVDQD